MRPFDESKLPPRKPASLADATSDGLMLAEYASRMKLKNAIIVGVLTRPGPFDPEEYLGTAAEVLDGLAEEFDRACARISDEIDSAEQLFGTATRAHDYRLGDLANLQVREAVLRALVTRFRSWRDDGSYLRTLIEGARADAWDDVSRAVEDSLDRSIIVVDADYQNERAERMRLLVTEDLASLAAESAERRNA